MLRMRQAMKWFLVCVILLISVNADANDDVKTLQLLLGRTCFDCHTEIDPESGVDLSRLETLNIDALMKLLPLIHEQVMTGEMPPSEANGLEPSERLVIDKTIRGILGANHSELLDARSSEMRFANYVNHELLFDKTAVANAATEKRRWLVSPKIFYERVIDVFALEGRERDNYSKRGQRFYGITNPFLLPDRSGIRYDDQGLLNGGHLLVMLNNAQWIAGKYVFAAVHDGENRGSLEYPDPKDRWLPNNIPRSYVELANARIPVGSDLIHQAVTDHFQRVLRRKPNQSELRLHTELTQKAIEIGGSAQGLNQLLISVLLKSEFLYRYEFGDGPIDALGRQQLSALEAADAISYAIGDQRPDQQLITAALQGALATREDYAREVKRLLNDDVYYRGQIDPSLNGKHYRSNETSHPKLVRFFRDFFGYPLCLKIFKDSPRSDGYYRNPGRGSLATPGWLTLEADRIVTYHVERDREVFRNLLTSDQFFVYHDKTNEVGEEIIKEWSEVYEKLKGSDWRNEPEAVLADNIDFIKLRKALKTADTSRPGELVNYMHYFSETFGNNRTPFTTIPWAHGYTFHHSPFYGLPPTPSIGRYGSWKSTKFQSGVEPKQFWDYPTQQPFAIENRKGILTHPAWLIAHSSNFHTDPIKRGKWIREKLLAGFVPDVPITVDAQIPDDPHVTLRERVESATAKQECWKCHRRMNPLGFAFEAFDDFGRYRLEEPLESAENRIASGDGKTSFDRFKTLPVNTNGTLVGTGDPQLDGPVTDAFELIDRLAASDRARQSMIRYAFRFFLGRNETLTDALTLQDADRAYLESNGSFNAVVISLLSSDSFRFRRVDPSDTTVALKH